MGGDRCGDLRSRGCADFSAARRWRWALALGALALGACGGETAAPFPAHALRLIVTFPAGGPVDFVGRALAERLGAELGQPVIVENRGGAGGTLGVEVLARAPADGYTLALASAGALAIAPSLTQLPYDVERDLAPLALIASAPEALVVPAALALRALPELLERARPGGVRLATSGSGTMPDVAGALLQRETGVALVSVPYRGAAPALADLLGGHVDAAFLDLPQVLGHVRAGRLVALALASEARAPALPELATTAELGWPAVLANNWYALVAPAHTADAALAALGRALSAALADPALRAALEREGVRPLGGTAQECAAFLRAEAERLGPLALAAGARWEN